MKILILALTLIAGMAQAAVWERPSGGYTPTNHSVNTTKYQIDRSNNVAISSVKVDGDMNKAFEGLNNLEARSAPSVVGQAGKFLSNNGASTFWGLISPTSISSGAATAGMVLRADGSGSSAFGLLDATSFPDSGVAGSYTAGTITVNSAGLITSATTPTTVSFTNVGISNSLFVSGSVVVSGTISATAITDGKLIASAVKDLSTTVVNFTDIPSWAKRVTITMRGLSTNGSVLPVVQLGTSSGYVTSGYLGTTANPSNINLNSSGIQVQAVIGASSVIHGHIVLTRSGGNNWVYSGVVGFSDASGNISQIGGSVSLPNVLNSLRFYINGTLVFDAGAAVVVWE